MRSDFAERGILTETPTILLPAQLDVLTSNDSDSDFQPDFTVLRGFVPEFQPHPPRFDPPRALVRYLEHLYARTNELRRDRERRRRSSRE